MWTTQSHRLGINPENKIGKIKCLEWVFNEKIIYNKNNNKCNQKFLEQKST
jgi:hypothetical protein